MSSTKTDALLKKLSAPTRNVVVEFDSSAKSWGYQEDSGTGSAVDRSMRNYDAAYASLLRRVLNLERAAAKGRQCIKDHSNLLGKPDA